MPVNTPWNKQASESTPWSVGTINSTSWQKQNVIPIAGNLLQEDGISHILQEDGSSKVTLE